MTQSNSNVNIQTLDVNVDSIRNQLITDLSELLGADAEEIDINAPFDSYGLDSAHALFLIGKAEKQYGIKMSPIMLWHYPTIALLSERLVEEFEDTESEILEI